jgi:SAM-dependent methyltransferase
MDSRSHWQAVYGAKAHDAVSWYAPHLDESLKYLRRTGLGPGAAVIDVGGGEATLVDDLLQCGYSDVTVLDISATALGVCRNRLGVAATKVTWLAADVLTHGFAGNRFDIWHDRAVFHFLTGDEQRRAYVRQIVKALRPGGFAIVGTFGPHGPDKCSGLPVMRYAPDQLHGAFGGQFKLIDSSVDMHTTPWGSPQEFVYCFCRLEQ